MDIFTTFISPRAQTHKYTLLRADKIEKGARNEGNLLVVACKLADLSCLRENDKSDFSITENRKLECFFTNPFLRLEKVTWRRLGFWMRFISIFVFPIFRSLQTRERMYPVPVHRDVCRVLVDTATLLDLYSNRLYG